MTTPPSMPKIGFALATYKDVTQVLDLLALLDEMFDSPPISIHHDQRKSRLDYRLLPPNVIIVPEQFDTGWGTLNTCLAMAAGVRALMDSQDSPDWFYLITGHCMPIQTAATMREELAKSEFDVYMRQSCVYPCDGPSAWQAAMQERYVWPNQKVGSFRESNIFASLFGFRDCRDQVQNPFSASYPCRVGRTYFTGNKSAALALQDGLTNREVLAWLKNRPIVDECLFASLLGNNPRLRISQSDLRFTIWGEGPHPKTLSMEDFDSLCSSGMHFARKLLPGISDQLRIHLRERVLTPQSRQCGKLHS